VRKVKVESELKNGKRKLSKDGEGEGTSSKKVKPRSVIEDSDGEDWLQDREDGVKKDMGQVEIAEEVRESSVSEAKVREETEKDKGKWKAKEARKMRRSERSELMREMIMAVWELGSKVDRFVVDEARASSVLKNRAEREYLEEWRRERHMERLRNARRLRREESEQSLGEE
jgi:hypothetical protein